jgi:hypothetical protein
MGGSGLKDSHCISLPTLRANEEIYENSAKIHSLALISAFMNILTFVKL